MGSKQAWVGHVDGPNTFRLDYSPWVFTFLSDQSGQWVLAGVHVENLAGVTSALLHTAPIEMAWRVFKARLITPMPGGGWSVAIGRLPGAPKQPKRRGDDVRQWTDQRLLDLAAEYVALCKIDRTPTASLAKREHLTTDRLRALLGRARDRDFLSRTAPGQSGGELTPKALELLKERP